MGPIVVQIVRAVVTQIAKYACKQAAKQAGKQALNLTAKQTVKQSAKQVGKQVGKNKNNNLTGGENVKRQFANEKQNIDNNKHFESLEDILKKNLKNEHSSKQQTSNYSQFGLPGNMQKTNIFRFP